MAERRYTLVFYAAVVTALAATYGVYRVLEITKEESRVPTRPVVVAAQDLPEGASLDRRALVVSDWPAAAVPAGAYASLDSATGRVTRVAVFKGEAIVPGRLAPAGTGPGLEVKITPGKRAMSVRIDDVAGISGLVQPNSRVDVLVTLSEMNGAQRRVSKLFMENMRVLSVGTQIQRGTDNDPISAATATLEVTPEEAERLSIAMREGSIQLVLRGYGDPDSIKTKGAATSDVLAQLSNAAIARVEPATPAPRPRPVRVAPRAPEPVVIAPPPPPRADSSVIQVFRGDKLSEQKFQKKEPGPPPGTP